MTSFSSSSRKDCCTSSVHSKRFGVGEFAPEVASDGPFPSSEDVEEEGGLEVGRQRVGVFQEV